MARAIGGASSSSGVDRSLQEYGRGLAGGLLVSLPLLYTMEMWWAGSVMSPERQLVYVAGTFVLLLGYNRYAGLHEDSGWIEVAIDSVEELGLGLVIAAIILAVLGLVSPDRGMPGNVGQIVVEGMTVAIGVSVGTAQLGGGDEGGGMATDRRGRLDPPGFFGQLTLALCGAVLFAANVAPTEEISEIAARSTPPRLLGLAMLSMALAALVLYFIDFTGARRLGPPGGRAATLAGTAVTYAVALVASAAILWLFGRFDGAGSGAIVAQTVVLGFPSALGASAGRLLLQWE